MSRPLYLLTIMVRSLPVLNSVTELRKMPLRISAKEINIPIIQQIGEELETAQNGTKPSVKGDDYRALNLGEAMSSFYKNAFDNAKVNIASKHIANRSSSARNDKVLNEFSKESLKWC